MAKISWNRAAVALDKVAPDLSMAARQLLLGQAYAETGFGNELPDGSNSNNWGSIGGSGDLGYYEWGDTLEGKKITRKVARFSTPEKGAEAFLKVVFDRYGAAKYAETGDAWAYARALWRDGPNQPELGAPSTRPAYYTGFPPGTAGFAPAGTKTRSKLDDWYRITAYARMIQGASTNAAKTLDEPASVKVNPPPKPDADSTDPLPASASSASAGDTVSKIGDTIGKSKPTGKSPEEIEAERRAAEEEEKRIAALDEERRAAEEAERARREAEEAAAKDAAAKKDAAKGGGSSKPGSKAPAGGASSDTVTTAAIVIGVGALAWLLLKGK